ncbi:hypothetical protein ACJX0J_029131, partial [Zea mays]
MDNYSDGPIDPLLPFYKIVSQAFLNIIEHYKKYVTMIMVNTPHLDCTNKV